MLELRLMLAHVLGIQPQGLIFLDEVELSPQQTQQLENILARRLRHEPLSRIFGEREFWSLSFKISPATLDPRPDSETLIEAVLKTYPDQGQTLKILDLGTGSGCLLLALLHEYPNAWGLGVDLNPAAALMALENAMRLNLAGRTSFMVGSWGQALHASFDIVISNPPYIPSQDVEGLAPDVRHYDPRLALDGGTDGLQPYRIIIAGLVHQLASGGHVFFEVGHDQADDVAALLQQNKFNHIQFYQDLAGIQRVVSGQFI